MMENAASAVREINLMEYWNVLVRRRWVVFTALVVLVTTVTIGSFLIPPTYRAVCTLQIEREQPNVLQFQQVQPVGYDYMSYTDFYQTQYILLSSRNVARKAMQKLDLRNDPVVNRVVGTSSRKGIVRTITSFIRKSPLEGLPQDPDKPYIEFILGGLDINPLKNTHLVEISFVSIDPELASRVANAVANSYIEFNQSARSDTTAQASEFIATQTAWKRSSTSTARRRRSSGWTTGRTSPARSWPSSTRTFLLRRWKPPGRRPGTGNWRTPHASRSPKSLRAT